MSFYPTENRLGLPVDFTRIDSTPSYTSNNGTAGNNNFPIGTIVRGIDATNGGGEFIYLAGVTGTVVGSIVTYDTLAGTTALAPITTKGLAQPLAVAMSANTSSSNYGWYQIEGAAVIKKTAVKVNPSVAIFLSGTTGRVMPTAATGREVLNARSVNAATVASATSTVTVLINRPHAQGQVI